MKLRDFWYKTLRFHVLYVLAFGWVHVRLELLKNDTLFGCVVFLCVF